MQNQTPKFVRLKTFEQKDINDLFTFICKNIALKNESAVKEEMRLLLGDTVFAKKEITSFDIINMISFYDIDFSLQLNYVESSPAEDFKIPSKSDGLKVDHSAKAMEEQKTQVVNSDTAPEVKKEEVKDDDLPEFP